MQLINKHQKKLQTRGRAHWIVKTPKYFINI